MRYLDEGAGPPVVMVHGNPTWSFYHRCLVPDHLGCGRSDRPEEGRYGFRLRDRVDDLAALLDHAGATRDVTLVVHDWGGMIGMAWAAAHADRVRRIVALNTAAFPLPAGVPLPRSLAWGRNTGVGAWLIRRHNAFCRAAVRWCAVRPLPPEVRHAYLAPYARPEDRLAVLKFVLDIPLGPQDESWGLARDTAAALAGFRDRPALLQWGAQDFVFHDGFLDEWRRRWPQAEVTRFAHAGHFVLEDAHEHVVPNVRAFLARHPL
jgi:haloalkane dehalogenase